MGTVLLRWSHKINRAEARGGGSNLRAKHDRRKGSGGARQPTLVWS